MNDPATAAQPRPALTLLVMQAVDEEGYPGIVGTSHLFEIVHPYRFLSRRAAAAVGNLRCGRDGYDGFRLHTPGHELAPALAISEGEIPF